jgi:hypothetical protein
MASRDHYVSQFHLKGFTDPNAREPQEPWLWVGDCATGSIQRRAPKNVGWSKGLFAGPAGLADRKATLESHLASQVESPAAFALRALSSRPQGHRTSIPGELGRYLAWAATRSLSMRQLYQDWIDTTPTLNDVDYVEQPPTGFAQVAPITRLHRMEHTAFGIREDVPSEEVELLRRQGWRLVLTNDDFLEIVHLQAWYFQIRFFPRLQWIVLGVPSGRYFIIGDRPVVWGFEDMPNAKPSALRHPDVQAFAPLTRSLALFGYHPSGSPPRSISYRDVNRVVASAARDWIAGPTREVVAEALQG